MGSLGIPSGILWEYVCHPFGILRESVGNPWGGPSRRFVYVSARYPHAPDTLKTNAGYPHLYAGYPHLYAGYPHLPAGYTHFSAGYPQFRYKTNAPDTLSFNF